MHISSLSEETGASMTRTIREVLEKKGHQVHTIDVDATVMDAITVMNQHHIGSVVVCEAGAWVGIFTERDVLTRIVAPRRDPDTTRVRDVMTRELFTMTPDQPLSAAMEAMTQRRCRHVPIVAAGKLHGMLSIGDVNKALHADLAHELHELESYISSPYVA